MCNFALAYFLGCYQTFATRNIRTAIVNLPGCSSKVSDDLHNGLRTRDCLWPSLTVLPTVFATLDCIQHAGSLQARRKGPESA